MNAEIISVGTELLLGHTINTDAAFVARELSAIGVNLLFACTVGDNPGRLRDALEEALGRSDVVITTGGLGPTDDDLTKETIASVAGSRYTLPIVNRCSPSTVRFTTTVIFALNMRENITFRPEVTVR